MTDFMSPETRSRVMSRIRSRNTRPELYVRRMIWAEGFRYRLHVSKLPGTPDLVLTKYRLAVFVHGCFWHQHDCSSSKRPSSNREYWDRKLDANVARDDRDHIRLEERPIWECCLETGVESFLESLRCIRAHYECHGKSATRLRKSRNLRRVMGKLLSFYA